MNGASTSPEVGSVRSRKGVLDKKEPNLFRVSAKGFEETYETKQDALKQANYLKRRAVKAGEAVKIKVTEEDDAGNAKVIHEVNIKADFYED
jgi:hypothetical protein